MRPLLALSLVACTTSLSAQKLVLPDNHNFMESPSYGANEGDANHWRGGTSHFQILYEASHFLAAGVAGPIQITHLRFRGEDGEANLGGQVFTNVTVQLGSTSITAASLSPVFATNRSTTSTTSGSVGTIATLLVAPSIGSCPNNWCIDLDLSAAAATLIHDPTSARPNLLVDITCGTPPSQAAPQFLVPVQDTTAHGAGVRGKSVWNNAPTALAGFLDATPPVVGIEFTGGVGGWPSELPARAEFFGGGCGGQHATIYQSFSQDQRFDLGAGLVFTPDVYPNPTCYTVTSGAAPLDTLGLGSTPDSTADDALVPHSLGFLQQPFTYPGGGSTTDILVCTNGFVWLDPAMTSAGWQPTKSTLLGVSADETARFLPFWSDLNAQVNLGMGARTGLHVHTVPASPPGAGNAMCYITWWNTGAYRIDNGVNAAHGHEVFDFQLVIHERTGVVEFRYGTMPPYVSTLWNDTMENAAIVGFSLGRISSNPLVGSLDPGSRDLSHELPFTTSIEGTTPNVALSATASPFAGSPLQTARMFAGQSFTWNVANVPAGTTIALLNLDLGASRPGIQVPPFLGLLAPNCTISTTLQPVVFGWDTWVLPGSNVVGTHALVVPSGWEGHVLSVQAMGVDLTAGAPFLIPWTSNAIEYTVGLD